MCGNGVLMPMMLNFYRNPVHRNPIAGAVSVSDVINNYTNVKSARVLARRLLGRYGTISCRVANPLQAQCADVLRSTSNGFRCARTVTP